MKVRGGPIECTVDVIAPEKTVQAEALLITLLANVHSTLPISRIVNSDERHSTGCIIIYIYIFSYIYNYIICIICN